MAAVFEGGIIKLSGAVTNAEFIALNTGTTATAGLTKDAATEIYVLQGDLQLLSGCDTSNLHDLAIETNGKKFILDSGVVSSKFNNISFKSTVGRDLGNRVWISGGGIELSGSSYTHGVTGGDEGGEGRLLDVINAKKVENTTIRSLAHTVHEPNLNFTESGRVDGLNLRRVATIGSTSTIQLFINNIKHYSRYSNGGYLVVYSGLSMMLVNYVPDRNTTSNMDNYDGQVRDHWVYWLGTSVSNFSSSGTLDIRNRKNELHNVAGGIRYYKFVGGEGAKVEYQESTGARPFLVDLTRADMLNPATHKVLTSDEQVEIVTQQFTYDNAGSWSKVSKSGQKIIVRKYGKLSTEIDCSGNKAIEVVGTAGAHAPVILADDPNFANTSLSVESVATLSVLYDLLCNHKAMFFNVADDLVSVVEEKVIIKTGYTLKCVVMTGNQLLDIRLQQVPLLITGNDIIIKLPVGGLKPSGDLTSLIGNIDASLDGNASVNYLKSSGKVSVTCIVGAEPSISSLVWCLWPAAGGAVNRTGIQTATDTQLLEATPGEQYFFCADGIGAYRSTPETFICGDFGEALFTTLIKITRGNGTNIVPTTLTAEQQTIADMVTYNATAHTADFALPSDYTTNTRWDSVNKVWRFTAEDFKPLAYKIEHIQSSQASLADASVIRVEDFAFVLSAASSLVFRQAPENTDCEMNLEAFTTRREGGGNLKFYDDVNGALTFSKGPPIVATVDGGANAPELVNALLNVQYGKLADGTTNVGAGTLGEHLYQFYPPEIVRQLLEYPLNGSTAPTRYQNSPGLYGNGTLGDALRNIPAIKTAVKD